jgi:small-conductance mechanosensitive channel
MNRFADAAAILLCLCLAVAATSGWTKDAKPSKQEAMALPEPLTKESIRELVSRLDDAQVRELLIKQLDRSATAEPPPTKKQSGMGAMAHSAADDFAKARARAGAVLGSTPGFPEAMTQVAARIAAPLEVSEFWKIPVWFLVMLAAGAAVELAFRLATRGPKQRFRERDAEGLAAAGVRLLLRGGIGIVHVAAFAAGALGLFIALWQGHVNARFVLFVALGAVVGARLAILAAWLLLDPSAPRMRLLPLDDRTAGIFYRGIVQLAVLFALSRAAQVTFASFDAAEDSVLLWDIVTGTIAFVIVAGTVWRLRAPVAALIRGTGEPGPLRRLLADVWAGLALLYFVAIYVSRLLTLLSGQTDPSNAPIISVLLLLLLPVVDLLACRILQEIVRRDSEQAGASALTISFEPVLRKAVHIVVIVAGLLVLADLWQIDLFAMAERSLGGRITGAFLGIAMTMLIAWMLWEVARTAIDQRMGSETVAQGHKVSRLRTLLPLIRATLQVTILVIAVLSVLAAMGVNILPLLAGASVVGVAIGFGSQTLVRDIVSGAFFLMDDAFRLGEYIEVGDAKGTVEKIGVRSVILRHHRGALNVLPYGEIKRLRNTSRDWMIMKMEFRLTYDTDLKKVKQIIKKIGKEIAEDPELSKHLIEPLKSQGVTAAEDSALVVRVKYMADPASGGAFTIRREAYAKIISAFSEAGIRFANRQVTVNVPPGMDPSLAAAAATVGETAKK